MWELFPSNGPPSPRLGMSCFLRKKLWLILHFLDLRNIYCWGGSPMLKTVKNGSGIQVDPPPCFFFSNFPFIFPGNVPQTIILGGWSQINFSILSQTWPKAYIIILFECFSLDEAQLENPEWQVSVWRGGKMCGKTNWNRRRIGLRGQKTTVVN